MPGPTQRSPVQARNWAVVQYDSVFVGIVSASGTFLPVFLVRLGGSGTAVGLLTALPAVTAFALAIPFGRWLQARGNIVPWYSRLRLAGWLSYAAMALAAAILPAGQAVPAMLLIWALASLPSTAGLVAFPIVMDGAAGPAGRFDLLGRRWAIAGVSTAIAVALGGQLLNLLPFPVNFECLFVAVTVAGAGSFLLSRQIVIEEPPRASGETEVAKRPGLGALARLVRAERPFIRYELRALVFTAGIGLAAPLLPLFYVHEVHAPDAWIGIIGASQSAGAVLGYVVARRVSLRRAGTTVLMPALLVTALAPATLAVIDLLPVVAAVAFVSGVAAAGAQLALFDRLMDAIPRQHGVTFSSFDQSLQNFGLIVAPNLGGLLAVTVGVRQGLVAAAVVLGIALVLFAADAGVRGRRIRLPLRSAAPPAA
jgi:MFS transporter